jgi:hypothetical protein
MPEEYHPRRELEADAEFRKRIKKLRRELGFHIPYLWPIAPTKFSPTD